MNEICTSSQQENDLKTIQSLLTGDCHFPRSWLGFHEEPGEPKQKEWVVRVWEPSAVEVKIDWNPGKNHAGGEPMQRLDDAGIFEWRGRSLSNRSPYLLHCRFEDGSHYRRYDPYYFEVHFEELDQHLFGEGTHLRLFDKLGAHLMKVEGIGGTRFTVWAPNAKRVSVVGEFNHWNGLQHPMQAIGSSGIWELFLPGIGEGMLYKFEIKGQNGEVFLKSDPFAFASEIRPSTASRVVNLEDYVWQDESWMENRTQQDPLKQPINIYEVHLGSWKRKADQENRFLTYREAVEELIPYTKEMGYTHLELLPLAEHPLDASWGYQVTGYFAPSSRYGSPADFMYFVDQCHQHGLGVIMDWVPGHFPTDSHGLARFDGTALYEHEDPRKGKHEEWGTLVFNYGRNEVRNFLISNALFWFENYHLDGIRVDAVASMLYLDYNRESGKWLPNHYGGRENLEAVTFIRQLNRVLFEKFPGILSIAEESTAWAGVSHPTYTGGLGFNFKWNMGWMNDSLRYMEKDPVHRKYEHQLMTFSMMYAFSENFVLALSHDEVVHGKRSLLEKMPGDEWQKRANLRLYHAYLMGHPGKKLIFMGGEFGQWREWDEKISLDWHLLENEGHRQLQHFCRELNRLYLRLPALYSNDFDWSGFRWIDHSDQDNSVLAFLRVPAVGYEGSEDLEHNGSNSAPVAFVFNFTPVPRRGYLLGLPEADAYHKIFDTDDPWFGGSGFSSQSRIAMENHPSHGFPCRVSLDLPPLAALMLQPG